MNQKPLVSVIIPTYNRARILSTAIESVLAQTYSNIQLLVIDDGSEDNTEEIIKKYPAIEYVRQTHGGQGAARNNGLQRAKGAFIASLDSDDCWNPDFLEKCIEKLEEGSFDFVFSNWDQANILGIYRDSFTDYKFMKPYLSNTNGTTWVTLNNGDLRKLYLNNCPSPSSSLVIRRSSMKTGWNHKVNIADDWCMLLDLILAKPCKAAFSKERLWKKHIDGTNIFDGRDGVEVMKLLYIEDITFILQRFSDSISEEERQGLQKKLVENLVVLAKHRVFRDKDLREFTALVRRALKVNARFTFTIFPSIVGKYLNVKMISLGRKLKLTR